MRLLGEQESLTSCSPLFKLRVPLRRRTRNVDHAYISPSFVDRSGIIHLFVYRYCSLPAGSLQDSFKRNSDTELTCQWIQLTYALSEQSLVHESRRTMLPLSAGKRFKGLIIQRGPDTTTKGHLQAESLCTSTQAWVRNKHIHGSTLQP